jgi:hypothetical protein
MLSSLRYVLILMSHILPKSCTLLLLRFAQETSPLGYVEDAEGYMEDTKTTTQAEKGYTHKTQGYDINFTSKSVPSREETGVKPYMLGSILKSRFQPNKQHTFFTSELGVMAILLKTAQKMEGRV